MQIMKDKNITDGINLSKFSSGISIQDLPDHYESLRHELDKPGVYLVIYNRNERPDFLRKSKAGSFKQKNPSYRLPVLNQKWINSARIMYIGKAAGRKGLYQRIRALINYGNGKSVGHWGGRAIWHIPNHQSLIVRWRFCPKREAKNLEKTLIETFMNVHGQKPFANFRT